MRIFKALSLIITAVAFSSLSGNAMAQSLQNTVNTTPVNHAKTAIPGKIKKVRVNRVVQALPTLAKPTGDAKVSIYSRVPYSKAASGHSSKFVINDAKHKVRTPVYYSKDALKSR